MPIKRVLLAGIVAGILMGVALFVVGAIAARVVYGPGMAPEEKFEDEQMKAWYFIWTKLLIGVVFGVLFSVVVGVFPLRKQFAGAPLGLLAGFVFWFLISLWNLSHPLVYGPPPDRDSLFWLVYTLGGFLALGASLGLVHGRIVSVGGRES